ncbi:hypothetical protein F3Y22_tig00112857pilonHSYRG00152 [Hibiscus syriacus]|uniref:Uncharacterized protein n=1 Tax=Hibiscus syriacus TaxID=106335 RepID=A0A6A2WSA1_HIBSY|nr:hypothetical protein F3Y22_tig00112857pilonHSYRG00152 [Hibiscus syriacus]
MRTRFLNVDYLSASQSTTGTLSFPNLPPPHLPPHVSNFNVDDLLHFDPFLNVNLPLQTENLPINAALSNCLKRFLSSSMSISEISRILCFQVETPAKVL